MLKAAASVEDGGIATLAADVHPEKTAATAKQPAYQAEIGKRGATMKQATSNPKFAYATGSRPLDGYTVKRGVGAGGFGEVYFAVSDAGKEVAVKRIQRNLDVELRGVSQCLNLKHPNLVSIYDIRYDDEGQAWVVMEYVRGESLKDVIDLHPDGMPLTEVLSWFRGVAAGVAYLHEHGIVHRDLKPGNIFLDEGVVKIGDYGLSKYISCSRRSGQTESVGTFHYMAPEIGRGVYGKEIDLYALGIILYELLTGRVPFDGESSHEIIMKHLTALPDVSVLPSAFRPVIERSLFKDPAKRFPEVKELLAAVETAAGVPTTDLGQGVSAPRQKKSATEAARGPVYIGETETDGMYFGPVQTVASAVPAAASKSSDGDEPIAKAIISGWKGFSGWFMGPSVTPLARVISIAVFGILFLLNIAWILPIGIILASLYLVYFGIRAIVLSLQMPVTTPVETRVQHMPVAAPTMRPPVAASTVSVAAAPSIQPRTVPIRKRKKWQDVAYEQLRNKTYGERLTELTGSMLMSAIVVAVMTVLTMVVGGISLDGSTQTGLSFAWIALVSLIGTWSLLAMAKWWEGRDGDDVSRRFSCLILGLVLGLVGFGLAQFLGLDLVRAKVIDLPVAWRPPTGTFASGGVPKFAGFLAYFGGLMVIMRWWSQADPMRPSRFSFWTTIGVICFACAWQVIWPFPQPWSLAVPVTMSIALQLSSSWITSSQRSQLRKGAEVY